MLRSFWTIVLEGKPTAFRGRTRNELLTVYRQLRARHPDTVLKWFSGGRFWDSPEAQRLSQRSFIRSRRRPKGGTGRRPT